MAEPKEMAEVSAPPAAAAEVPAAAKQQSTSFTVRFLLTAAVLIFVSERQSSRAMHGRQMGERLH